MLDKFYDSLINNLPRYINRNTLTYTSGTVFILYFLSNLPPRPPSNSYMMRKY